MGQEKKNINVNGMSKSHGNLECDELKVDGMFKVDGDLKTSDLTCNGMVKITGNVQSESISMDGMLKIGGDIDTKNMDINGLLKAKSISGEKIEISGSLNIKENISCDAFYLVLNGKSSVNSIEGTHVNVNPRRWRHQLKVNSISADEIDIENVKCDTISGDKIQIGKGCKVDNITYITSLDIDANATVKKSQKAV